MNGKEPTHTRSEAVFNAGRKLQLQNERHLLLHALPPVGFSRSRNSKDAPSTAVRALTEPDLETILTTFDRVNPALRQSFTKELYRQYHEPGTRTRWQSLLQDGLEFVVTAERLRRAEAGEPMMPFGTHLADGPATTEELAQPIEERIAIQNHHAANVVTLNRAGERVLPHLPVEAEDALVAKAKQVCDLRTVAIQGHHELSLEQAYLHEKLTFEQQYLAEQLHIIAAEQATQ